MSNRKRLRANKKAVRCPKCRTAQPHVKIYSDNILYMCKACQFPWMVDRITKKRVDPKPKKTIAEKLKAVLG